MASTIHPGLGDHDRFDAEAARADPALFRRFLPEIAHRTTGEVLAHPDFARLRRRYVVDTMASYATAVFPGGLQSTAYRSAAVGAIVCLHAAYDPDDRATWPTLSRLKQAVATFDLSSPRQVDDFVARLVSTGYVALQRPACDGRLRLLRATEKLLAWDRSATASYYGVLDALYPDAGGRAALVQDPEFQAVRNAAATTIFHIIGHFIAENRDLLPFLAMYNGARVLMLLAARAEDGLECDGIDLEFLQETFGVSRSHVRNILSAAEAGGLLAWSGPDRRAPRLTPRGLFAVDRFIADTLSSNDMSYRMARMRMGLDPGRPPGD